MSFARPPDLAQALDHLAADNWCVLAGGTDIYPAHVERPIERPVLDISGLAELRGIKRTDAGWRIGALTRWRDILRTDLPPAFDGLKQAARQIGGVQIQNAGTLAGNLCNASPAADGVPPLLTLDAKVELTAAGRGTRTLPLAEFIRGNRETALAPDEVMTAVLIPAEAGSGVSRFMKLGARSYLVISIAMTAVRLAAENRKITEARVALGACSPVALRLETLEQALIGAPLEHAASIVTIEHLAALTPIDDIRATADYRLEAAVILIRRALASAAAGLP